MSSILKDTPTPVNGLKTELPRHLGRVAGRCLAREVTMRFQTALDVRNALRALSEEVSTPSRVDTIVEGSVLRAGRRSRVAREGLRGTMRLADRPRGRADVRYPALGTRFPGPYFIVQVPFQSLPKRPSAQT